MKESIKKELWSWGIIAIIALILYATGLHTQVIGFFQRAILATGLIRPDTEQLAEKELENQPTVDLNIALQGTDEAILNLEQFRGKVLFINLWATWCPPCLAEMPGINNLYRDLRNEDIVFLMISVDKDFAKAKAYVDGQEFSFPIYQPAGRWSQHLNSSTIPTTFVIDQSGKLVLEHRGMAKYNTTDFKAFLRGLL